MTSKFNRVERELREMIQEVYMARHHSESPREYDILLDEEIELQLAYKAHTGHYYKIAKQQPKHLNRSISSI